jgi:SAM-dependent methyltransferase
LGAAFPLLAQIRPGVLSDRDASYLKDVLGEFGGCCPDLRGIWRLMDRAWGECGCDASVLDDRVSAFYGHPVWLLNGLFIEQDPQSIALREEFVDWIAGFGPSRVADFGGGFGTLAAMLARRLPGARVDVIEPHAHAAAVARTQTIPNMRYVEDFDGDYDLVVATDVFEHVEDPVALAAHILAKLRIDGRALFANCFAPVIRCHLPEHFHLRATWPAVMRAMGMEDLGRVGYGRAHARTGEIDLVAARAVEARSRQIHAVLGFLPTPLARAFARLLTRRPAVGKPAAVRGLTRLR